MRRTLLWFFVGIIVGALLSSGSLYAQHVLIGYGLNAGVAKPFTVDANGNLNIVAP